MKSTNRENLGPDRASRPSGGLRKDSPSRPAGSFNPGSTNRGNQGFGAWTKEAIKAMIDGFNATAKGTGKFALLKGTGYGIKRHQYKVVVKNYHNHSRRYYTPDQFAKVVARG